MKKWKVKYENITLLRVKHPFYKLEEIVEANTRKEAIDKVRMAQWSLKNYRKFTASPIK